MKNQDDELTQEEAVNLLHNQHVVDNKRTYAS